VSQRTKEVGIRLAIGAQPRDVLKLIVSEGLNLALVGIGVGLVAALLGTRVLRSLLFGVSATDPIIFFLNALVIAAIALPACYLPARRARRINPLVALREE
jgi:ABC-type antimicrobial peptide transport system permease subunit